MSKRYRNQTLFAVAPALMKSSYEKGLMRMAADREISCASKLRNVVSKDSSLRMP